MTLEQVKALLDIEYERASEMEYVRDPIAFALYETLVKVDKERRIGE